MHRYVPVRLMVSAEAAVAAHAARTPMASDNRLIRILHRFYEDDPTKRATDNPRRKPSFRCSLQFPDSVGPLPAEPTASLMKIPRGRQDAYVARMTNALRRIIQVIARIVVERFDQRRSRR